MNWVNLFEKVLFNQPIEDAPSRPTSTWTVDYAVWRLWQAKIHDPAALVDHAVLTRQCLRWMSPNRIRGDRLNEDKKRHLERVGVHLSLSGYLEAEPYRPNWLDEGATGDDLDALPQVASINESFPAEEWLQRATGKTTWRSHAQKEACWTALTAQPGETNLIGLPTGAGKSLVFQITAAFSDGLTVVVVPTLALGLDQHAIATTLPTAATLNPRNYSSEDGTEVVRDAVANRQCRLLFTSPEACVSGHLHAILDQHARDGWLKWVVIDEAHIVESWGADFRIEFQLLGALVRDWRQRSAYRLRTLLLSATFADSTQEMLRGLFVEREEHWKANVVQRLRPEIHYHIRRALNVEEQTEWVKEALLKLPRPLILYVTEKKAARLWYNSAKTLGFKRVECFHGDITKKGERKRIMEAWRSDRIDLMVATSAFGMGVDKPDVRAVIHACFPESIDRFYQEVGRGGRDGATIQSVMIYTDDDKRAAKGLAPTLLKPSTINDRWAALWDTRKSIEGDTEAFRVRSDSRQKKFLGIRTYQENVRWNKRLLQMLHRAKLLSITSLHSEKTEEGAEEYVEWVTIKELQFPSVDSRVGERMSTVREEEKNNINVGFKALEICAQGFPVCRGLQKYYGDHVTRACGSCRVCRIGNDQRRSCRPLQWSEESPSTNPTVSVVPMARIDNSKGRADWILAIRRTLNQGVVNRFIVDGADFDMAASLLRETMHPTASLRLYRLDTCKDIDMSLIKPGEQVVALHLADFRLALSNANKYGKKCAHWMPKDQIEDQFERSRFTQDYKARLFDCFETWLFDSQPIICSLRD